MLETPQEEVGATFCFEGGVAAQTNLAHTRDFVEMQLNEHFQLVKQNPTNGDILHFDLSEESEETEGSIWLCPSKLMFVKLGKRHVVKRVEPVKGNVVQYPNVRR